MKNSRRFAIIGAGGLAKEVYFLALECGWAPANFIGFIEHSAMFAEVRCLGSSFPVIDEQIFLETFSFDSGVALFIGIGNPDSVVKVARIFGRYTFPNLIHPSVSLHRESVHFGVGNCVTAGCTITCDVSIGSFNYLNLQTIVGHDVSIGNFNTINPGVCLCGNVTLGDAAFIGARATILQNLSIGNGAVIGASSLVRHSVGASEVVYGVPAQTVRKKDVKG